MNFPGQWIQVETIILSEVTQTLKDMLGMYSLISEILAPKLRISMIQLTDHMKLNKKEGQSVDASIPLRRGNKIIMGGRGREGPGWERGQGGEEGNMIRYWVGGTGLKT